MPIFKLLFIIGSIFTLFIVFQNHESENAKIAAEYSASFKKMFPQDVEGGYAWPQQVSHGRNIRFYLSGARQNSKISICRLVTPVDCREVLQVPLLLQPENTYSQCSVEKGCLWQHNAELTIPEHWPSGLYKGTYASEGGARDLFFSVSPRVDNPSKILFLHDWTSLNAYNMYGGANFYEMTISDEYRKREDKISHEMGPKMFSLKRPLASYSVNRFFSPPKVEEKNVYF